MSFFSWCQIVLVQNCLVPNCPFSLCWCQIVRCQIVLVPNCPGAKLSGAKLSHHPHFPPQPPYITPKKIIYFSKKILLIIHHIYFPSPTTFFSSIAKFRRLRHQILLVHFFYKMPRAFLERLVLVWGLPSSMNF